MMNILDRRFSRLYASLHSEITLRLGEPAKIFFDRNDIAWGQQWRSTIKSGLASAAFLIPIITPAFLKSGMCREEFEEFRRYENQRQRNDLILPIYYVDCPSIERPDVFGAGEIASVVTDRQYVDWRGIRYVDEGSKEYRRSIGQMAARIVKAYTDIEVISGEPEGLRWTQNVKREADLPISVKEVLDEPIDVANLVLYSGLKFPNMQVSVPLTSKIVNDMRRDRYRILRDIDDVVNVARDEVAAYAEKAPKLFRYSTDFISKSLIFVDSDFRATHRPAPQTLEAAKRAGITKF